MEIFKIKNLSDIELQKQLQKHNIGLTIEEARKICKILGRDPTLTEAIIWGNQGSEHASYKSTRKFLKCLPTTGHDVILGPCEDSGIIKLCDLPNGDSYGIVVSHESHNSPSQIVPYEGAATGVGGIMRDIVCMGSKAIGILDSLRFGSLDLEKSRIIAKGCVNGVGGYGNPLGVPNLGGDIYFDDCFRDYCLVNVFALGLIKESQVIHSFAPKQAGDESYDYILVGKPTDNSGFGGAAFSSKSIDELNEQENKGAVQEPNPFLERHLMASTYDLFKKLEESGNLGRVGYKDLGAGGVICASVELVADQGFGGEVSLDDVHKSIDNLDPQVIACSETQERFMWVCHPDLTQMILEHYNKKWSLPEVSKGAKASRIGKVVNGGQYKMYHKGELVCDAKAKDITEGLLYDREIAKPVINFQEPRILISNFEFGISNQIGEIIGNVDFKEIAEKMISSVNLASSQCVYEKYDKNVQGNTYIDRSESEASVISPLKGENIKDDLKNIGISVAQTGSGRYGLISPYDQATNSVAKACLLVASTGATPICITDCLNYGNPEIPEKMWEFSQGISGIKNACVGIGIELNGEQLPIISGNVSLYKDVPPSTIIGIVGKIEKYKNSIGKKLKSNNSVLILVGKRLNELGGSEFYRNISEDNCSGISKIDNICDKNGRLLGKNVPKTNFKLVAKIINATTKLISEGKILSCNVISIGGLYASIISMIMPNQKDKTYNIGIDINYKLSGLSELEFLFSESLGLIIEVKQKDQKDVLKLLGKDAIVIGNTNRQKFMKFTNNFCEDWSFSNEQIYNIWSNGLRKYWH